MNNENFHPVQKTPPLAHALHRWNESTRTLTYEYNGEDILTISMPESEDAGFRHGSDGTMQSISYTQQIYVMAEKPMWITIQFALSPDAVCMKPQRAGSEEAILGQRGNVLIDGVNGIYDVDQDLLIDVHGCQWRWQKSHITHENGKSYAVMEVYLNQKPLFINLRMMYYRNHLGYPYHEPWNHKPKGKPVAGWCSWEAYRRDIDAEKLEEVSSFLSEKLRAYGLEYIQVDDGYQKMPLPCDPEMTMAEGWLTCEESRFQKGHAGIVSKIQEHGFIPGIWTNANITNEAFASLHKENLLTQEGELLKGEWIDYLYNCTPKTLETQVEPIFAGFRQAGYEYVKIDAIRHLLFDGLHEAVRLGILSNDEAQDKFRSYMEATKRGLGDSVYYLASWGVMNEVIGLADACRIAMDANPTWAGIRMQLFEMARWFHSQRILFLNDPDHVCVRTKPEWAQSVLSLISLSGGLYMLSDTVDAYSEEKLEIIQKTLPPLETRTAESGPLNLDFPAYTWTKLHGFAVQSHETPVEMEEASLEEAYAMAGNYPTMEDDHPFSTLWSFHLEQGEKQWCVMGRIATIPLKKCRLSLRRLGLDGNRSYHAFDFWRQEYLGVVCGEIQCRPLEIGCCQIVGLREVTGIPQLIASSRHVSMDAVSVREELWEEESGTLTLSLEGISGTTQSYFIAVPEAYRGSGTQEDIQAGLVLRSGIGEVKLAQGLIQVEIQFAETKEELSLTFQNSGTPLITSSQTGESHV